MVLYMVILLLFRTRLTLVVTKDFFSEVRKPGDVREMELGAEFRHIVKVLFSLFSF